MVVSTAWRKSKSSMDALNITHAAIPLALYIHVPWCKRKCPYCDFNSHALAGTLPEAAYIAALLADLEQDVPRVWGRRISSIFIGGGTPSLLGTEALERLLSGVRARLPLLPNAEITLEVNPGATERGQFAELRALGINRLSIGVQSFNNQHLQTLGRIHERKEAFAAAEAAHAAGFDNFNLDLMFGLPGQSMAQAQADVANAIALQPAHISYYQLTIEPNTWFYHAPPTLPDEDLLDAMQEAGQAQLAAHGYPRYEISAYAAAQRRCQHNVNYWEFGDYLGIGAGAHGKLTNAHNAQIGRLWKIKHPEDYLAHASSERRIGAEQVLAAADLPLEFLLNALRLAEGVPASLFAERTGLALNVLEPGLRRARERGLLEMDAQRLQASAMGLRFLNDLLHIFMRQ